MSSGGWACSSNLAQKPQEEPHVHETEQAGELLALHLRCWKLAYIITWVTHAPMQMLCIC